jgi:asparagine synthase (glutamine-hydrolysing)
MCGIAGLVWKTVTSETREQGQQVTSAMLSAMHHRGPDGHGIFAHEQFALGHLRLSIIDIQGGAQPMSSPDGHVHLSYNGEIYGYEQLRVEQKNRGWKFATCSDSETLLAGYLQDGAEFDTKLNGMYAYALADLRPEKRYLQLGIDPVGIKPLYLAETKSAVIFASEMRAILAGLRELGESLSLNHEAVTQYLLLGWVPAPNTMLSGVHKLVPGGRCRIKLGCAEIESMGGKGLPLPATIQADVGDTLDEVMRRQVVSDAPLGFFLSGGIDSSLLVTTAQRIGIQPKTFTVRFAGEGHGVAAADESEIARMVAKHCGAEHHELTVSASTLKGELETALIAMDQPIADPACLPLLVMARFAREHVKVCLSGDGGDELFLGYPRHRLTGQKSLWHKVPTLVRSSVSGAASLLPTRPSRGIREKLRKLRVGVELISAPNYFAGPFSGRHAAALLRTASLPSWASHIPAQMDAVFEADMYGQLAGQMLPKTDHVTMFSSLETRVPFLDLEMIKVARMIPMAEKLGGGKGKAPLRTLLAHYLPPEVTKRPKQGFRVPLTSWFRHDLAQVVRARLLDPKKPADGIVSKSAIETLLDDHIAGREEHSIRIWSLLALQSWLDRLPGA